MKTHEYRNRLSEQVLLDFPKVGQVIRWSSRDGALSAQFCQLQSRKKAEEGKVVVATSFNVLSSDILEVRNFVLSLECGSLGKSTLPILEQWVPPRSFLACKFGIGLHGALLSQFPGAISTVRQWMSLNLTQDQKSGPLAGNNLLTIAIRSHIVV